MTPHRGGHGGRGGRLLLEALVAAAACAPIVAIAVHRGVL